MEVRQRTELTGTNRSCGLTTYFSQRWSCTPALSSANRTCLGLAIQVAVNVTAFESRREKVQAISNHATHEDNACGCLFLEETIALLISLPVP